MSPFDIQIYIHALNQIIYNVSREQVGMLVNSTVK